MFPMTAIDEEQEILRLNRGERLLVTVLRRLVLGCGMCAGVTREFNVLCGPQAGEVLMMIRLFIGMLDRTARRQLTISPPGWFALTADERHILSMLRSAQCGEEELLAAQVRWFSRLEWQPLLVRATRSLATVLITHDLRMSDRRASVRESPAGGGELQAGRV